MAVMHAIRTRLGWALAIIAVGLGILAWPLATGAGAALALAAVFAGVRAAIAVALFLAVGLAVIGAQLDANDRHRDSSSRSERPR
jgi:hypothetical protein